MQTAMSIIYLGGDLLCSMQLNYVQCFCRRSFEKNEWQLFEIIEKQLCFRTKVWNFQFLLQPAD